MLCYVTYSSTVTLNYYISLSFSTYFFKSASPIQVCEQSQKKYYFKKYIFKKETIVPLPEKVFPDNEKILFYHFESGHIFTKQI